ncbi:MAG: hypothetical protein K2P81_15905 [Bacteriovoracaceae bacterium]|nr:hypothetical protein [Bacteriovoracaceae bacterium]
MFFLKKKYVLLLLALALFSLFFFTGFIKFLLFLCCSSLLWLYRRKPVDWQQTEKIEGEIYLSPVDGEVVKIDKWTDPEAGFEYSEIRVKMSYTDHWGLYLPTASEMEYLKDMPGERMNRKNLSLVTTEQSGPLAKTDMVLRSNSGMASRIRFIHCETGRIPKIWMKSGDRGTGAACFGYYPFGGSLIFYIPMPSDVLVVVNEKIKAGESVLAVCKVNE